MLATSTQFDSNGVYHPKKGPVIIDFGCDFVKSRRINYTELKRKELQKEYSLQEELSLFGLPTDYLCKSFVYLMDSYCAPKKLPLHNYNVDIVEEHLLNAIRLTDVMCGGMQYLYSSDKTDVHDIDDLLYSLRYGEISDEQSVCVLGFPFRKFVTFLFNHVADLPTLYNKKEFLALRTSVRAFLSGHRTNVK